MSVRRLALPFGLLVAAAIAADAVPAQGGGAAELRRWGINLPPLEDLSETRDRPLFSPTREPPAERTPPPTAAVEAPAAKAAAEPVFELTGIVIGEDLAIAVLRNRTSEQIQRVRHGDTVAGWTVAEIGPRHVILRRDSVTQRLQLFQTPARPPVPGGASPPPGAAPQQAEQMPQLPRQGLPAADGRVRPPTGQGAPVPAMPPTQERPLRTPAN